ncbi:MAG TPA: amidohydrolase family protein [Opitutaceae bacterium]|nr:amidohydrolase family protein [Opitutaceae bacterium]
MNFTDAHMHFWDRDALGQYTWLHEVPAIAHRHTTENLLAEAPGHLPEKIVFVEAGGPPLEEVQWVSELAAREPRIRAIVAKVVINAGERTTADLAALREFPLVKGVRHHFEHDAVDFCARPEFIRGVQEAARLGYSFDICCKHPQLPAVIELVSRCPQASFILDHGGKPGIRDGLMDPWRAHIRALAALPNIVCKLSGLATEAGHADWTEAQLRPYAEHLLECFGSSRLLFGGDWPVAKLAVGYVRWLEIAQRFVESLNAAEQAAVFRSNADRVYRI